MKKILVVDDDKDILILLKDILEEQNYDIHISEDVIGATNLLKNNEYDLILLDIMMSWMSGLDYCITLKHTCHTSQTPVVFLTAKDSKEDIKKGIEAGAIDYIVKPFKVLDLLERIENIFEGLDNER